MELAVLPDDVIKYLLDFLPQIHLLSVLCVNKRLYRIANTLIVIIRNIKLASRLGKILSLIRYFPAGANLNIYHHPVPFNLCRYGHIEAFDYLLKQKPINSSSYGYTNIINIGLHGACMGGHMNIVKYLITRGAARRYRALYYACKNGNIDIIKHLISNGARDWNSGLEGACKGERMDIIKYMITLGANDWDRGLSLACKGGHIKICEYIISMGAITSYCSNCQGKNH